MRRRRSSFVLIFISLRFRSRLPCLLLQDLARVPDTLLLVRIRLAEAADIGRDLSDELPIDAADRDVRLLVDRDVDSWRHVEHHGVRVAKGEHDLLALHLRAVPDADDVELALVALGDAGDRIRDERARQAME